MSQKLYEHHGQKLVDLVEGMERDGMDPKLAMTLLLDKAIDLTFHITGGESEASKTIELMTVEKAELYWGKNERNWLRL